MGLKEMLDETKEQAIEQGKKAIMKVLRPILLKGLAIILIVIVVAGSTIAIFDALGDVISGIITGAINAINSIASKFSRWLINTGIKDDSDNYWIKLDEPYGEDNIEVEYEGDCTAVALRLASTDAGAIGAPTNSAVSILNGDLRPFDKDDSLGINFTNIYGLDENYQKTNLDATFVVGYGKEGIALFDYGGTLKAVNTEVTDIEFEHISLTETGFILADTDKTKLITYDFRLNVTNRDVSQRTLPDIYLEQLYSTGLSLDNLRVLVGRVNEKLTVDEILADNEQKEKAEKYIKEFLRADLISSSTHKTKNETNIKEDNDNWIDGGTYVWRTVSDLYEWDENSPTETALNNSGNPEIEKMIFVPYDEFHKTFTEDMGSGGKELDFIGYKGWLKDYTINEEGNIEVFVFDLKYSGNENIPLANLLGRPVATTARIATIDYKEYIREYTMPFEFLMATAYTCENPEYAYHLAFLGRETMIDLVICDEYTIEYENNVQTGYVINKDRLKKHYTSTVAYDGSQTYALDPSKPDEQLEDKIIEENVTFGASTTFDLKGSVNAFVVRANSWDKWFKTTLYRRIVDPQINPVNRTGIAEEFGVPTSVTEETSTPVQQDQYGQEYTFYTITAMQHHILTSEVGTSTKYKVEYATRGDEGEYKLKAFYGLLRTKEESKAEDSCESDEDIINHLKEIEPDENGYNTKYMLQQIGINDEPINIMANERDVLYRQIETFGNAFNKETVTGEQEHTTEDENGDTIIIRPEGTTGVNYQWLFDYLDYAFKDFHLGKFQELENMPADMNELFGGWGNGGPGGNGGNWSPGNAGGYPPGNYADDGKEFTNERGQTATAYIQRAWDSVIGDNFGGWGCGQSSVAAVISMFKGKEVGNPWHVHVDLAGRGWGSLASYLAAEGIPNHTEYFSDGEQAAARARIKEYLNAGKPVILNLKFNYGGIFYPQHFITAMGIKGNEMLILDSGQFWANGYYDIDGFVGPSVTVKDLTLIDAVPPSND